MIRHRRLAVPSIALVLVVPGATAALSPIPPMPVYVTGSVLSCDSIGGCAYRITTRTGDGAIVTTDLAWSGDGSHLVAPDGALLVPAGPLSISAEGSFVSDVSVNGQREVGPTHATCDLAVDVPPDPRGMELTLVVSHGACLLEAVPSERADPEAPPSPISPLLALHALPDGLDPAQARPPFVTLLPTSPQGVVAGEPFATNLGHCGLGSPIDIDGAFWDPIGAVDAAMGPIESEEEWGELINASAVEAILVGADRLDLRTPLGTVLVLARHDGAGDYPMCD